ncbi:MAG: enoyl-CoA hydratase/isomerase family protein [Dehalococcoidia bacterium]
MATDDLVLYEKRGAVAWLTLNRPSVLNAVNLAMRDELWVLFQAVRDDPDVHVAVITGAGRAFCAGADISEFGTAPSLVESRRARRERDLWQLMLDIDKPLVAAMHGYALGAGLEMSLLCDFRLAAEDTVLGLPEVRLGYIPSAGGTQLLPRTVRGSLAREMIMTGQPIDAERAHQAGLLTKVVAAPDLANEAEALATALAERPPSALRAAKRALRSAFEMPLAQGLAVESALAARLASAG